MTHEISEIIPEIKRAVLLKNGKVFFDGDKSDALTSERVSGLYDTKLSVHEKAGFYAVSYG